MRKLLNIQVHVFAYLEYEGVYVTTEEKLRWCALSDRSSVANRSRNFLSPHVFKVSLGPCMFFFLEMHQDTFEVDNLCPHSQG
jgi:hypothetical protein